MTEQELIERISTDKGAKKQLRLIARENKFPRTVSLALELMYDMQRDEGNEPGMAYTKTLLHLNWTQEEDDNVRRGENLSSRRPVVNRAPNRYTTRYNEHSD